MISQKAVDLIIASEVSSRSTYEKLYHRPEWPGGGSGVTVGIGYDLGMASRGKIEADWKGRVSDAMLAVMLTCAGVHGDPARPLCTRVKNSIDIPWDKAMEVFMGIDLPNFTAKVCQKIKRADQLPADCLGAIVSLAYNRGENCFIASGDRYIECRSIKEHVETGNLTAVPGDFRSMSRLWPDMKGLRDRRAAEANLFYAGIKNGDKVTEPIVIKENPTPLSKPKAGKTEKGVAAGTVIATSTAASQSGLPGWQIALIIAVGIAIAIGIFFIIKSKRASSTARAKDFPTTGVG